MVEQTLQQPGAAGARAPETRKGVTEQAAAAGREYKDKAADVANASADKLKEQAAEFADAARDAASQAADKFQQAVSENKGAGADYVGNVAEAMRRAAREFDRELPIAGKYIRKAAAQVDNFSDSVRTGDFNDLVRSAQSFARRQPAAFLGIATLTGFAAVRFLKSSSDGSERSFPPGYRGTRGQQTAETGYRDEFSK